MILDHIIIVLDIAAPYLTAVLTKVLWQRASVICKAVYLKEWYWEALKCDFAVIVIVITDLQVSKHSKVGQEMFAIVGFTNTLDYDLTNVTVRMEGINLFPVKTKTYR